MANEWSDSELRASVVAYLDMLKNSDRGIPFVKKAYYRELAERFPRSEKSFELRLRNISQVMDSMGREWVPGLVPAANVGADVSARIERLIGEVEAKVKRTVATPPRPPAPPAKQPPAGNKKPKAVPTQVTEYLRDLAVRAWVIQQANGVCECCQTPAPFKDSFGLPFLEVHHIRQLADGGSDTTSNSVAVCPNCHRALHLSAERHGLVQKMYARIARLERE
jgi:5-methylcytosine-specific restriction protein A